MRFSLQLERCPDGTEPDDLRRPGASWGEVILGWVARVRDGGFPGAVRAVGHGDMPALVELTRDRGWLAGEAMWRLVLAAGDGFGIDAPDGGLAGAVAVTRYAPGLAVIGMLLVASRHARRGLGRRLMQHALAQVPGQLVYLHATPSGRPSATSPAVAPDSSTCPPCAIASSRAVRLTGGPK